jgi:tetratricopeptide (TPR) repeat protein
MTKGLMSMATAFVMAAGLGQAQQAKSQKEVEALQAIQNAQNPDARIAAVDALITKFADTEFKAWALTLAADAAQRKGDSVKTIVYAQSALEADPKNYQAMLMIAGELARTTRENDLDREEKLARAEKMVNEAMTAVNTAQKPNPQLPDEQWASIKKDFIAQAHEDLGLVALARKKNDVAITEFKAAVDGAANPDPATMVRLASAYDQAGKYDEGLAVINKILAMPDINPVVKQYAQAEKTRAEQGKAKK